MSASLISAHSVGNGVRDSNDPKVALHTINSNLFRAEGNGELYPLLVGNSALSYDLYPIEGSKDAGIVRIKVHGFEDDPVIDDDIPSYMSEYLPSGRNIIPDNDECFSQIPLPQIFGFF